MLGVACGESVKSGGCDDSDVTLNTPCEELNNVCIVDLNKDDSKEVLISGENESVD